MPLRGSSCPLREAWNCAWNAGKPDWMASPVPSGACVQRFTHEPPGSAGGGTGWSAPIPGRRASPPGWRG